MNKKYEARTYGWRKSGLEDLLNEPSNNTQEKREEEIKYGGK